MKWVYKNKKTLIFAGVLLLVACYFISYTNVLRNKRVKLECDGRPFIAYSFAESYTEGMRYILITGQEEHLRAKLYLFDLKEEKVLSLPQNAYLHASFVDSRYSVSVFIDGRWECPTPTSLEEQIIAMRDAAPDQPMRLSFSDKLEEYATVEIDLNTLTDYKTTKEIRFVFSETGLYTKIYTTENSYLLDMETQQIIYPPKDFDEGNGFDLIANDSLALYHYRKVWNIKENTILQLDYDKKYDNYGKSVSRDGEYIYWGAGSVYACSTRTGEMKMVFDGDIVTAPDFDMNDIKFISDHEVGAVGSKLMNWFGLGPLSWNRDNYIMKYNFDTHSMRKIKLPFYGGQARGRFAWSYDKSQVYFMYAGKDGLYKMKI